MVIWNSILYAKVFYNDVVFYMSVNPVPTRADVAHV